MFDENDYQFRKMKKNPFRTWIFWLITHFHEGVAHPEREVVEDRVSISLGGADDRPLSVDAGDEARQILGAVLPEISGIVIAKNKRAHIDGGGEGRGGHGGE